jgi:trimethylamine--corrinoid protein Co-methyltransferase
MLGGVEVSDETLALESIAEVGPGGHHLGTAHTLERYRSEFYLPFVSDRQNYDKWLQDGQTDAARRAHGIANVLLGEYERPPLDPGVREELRAYVERRKSELAGTG